MDLSQTPNHELMRQARKSLRGGWGTAILGSVIYWVLTGLIHNIPKVGWIGGLVLEGPLLLGYSGFFLSMSRKQDVKISQLFDGFTKFTQAFIAYILMAIFILLWSLLLIVPGIIAMLSYSMTFFILHEEKEIEGLEAIRKSKSMMKGNRWKLFCLGCRFLGWFLLGILSFGIGFLWIMPYLQTSFAQFYDDVKKPGQGRDALNVDLELNRERSSFSC